jgi:hypothetical protein
MATPRAHQTPSLAIIDALDSLAAQVRKNHPEVPTNIVFALASGNSRGGAVHGHFAPKSWKDGAHEILLGGESLARGAEATFGTLIHELAHAAAHAQGIKDTSNAGRYHNKRFKEIAEGMGITLEQVPTIGWSKTTLSPETAATYKVGLDKLAKALVTYRVGYTEPTTTTKTPRKTTKFAVECPDCAEPVTISKLWFEAHPIVCGEHAVEFEVVTNEED